MSPAVPFTLALLVAALQARQPIWNPDIFWHLKAGEWILMNGYVPRVDPFSFTMAGQPWVAHEWLFEALLAGCYQAWGPTGLFWLVFLLAALYIAGLYLLCR
ncbi:MAG: hypothetical protein PHU78_03670, partial [Heliobacteriaceae bacterium]|nr:hypothetical protein [Heliobacteriaceae bacterium]